MLHVEKILYPTDFSELAAKALPHAVYLADQFGAELHMLHAFVLHEEDPYNPAHHFPDVGAMQAKLHARAREHMRAIMAPHEGRGIKVEHVYRRGPTASQVIVDYAGEVDVDLVVMSTHGRRHIRHLFVGSVTEEVIRMAPCPVLSLRGDGDGALLREVRRVLVPVDFSEHSAEAVQVGRDVAAAYEAELQLLHILHAVLHPAFYNMGATSIRDLQPDIDARTEQQLRDLLAKTSGPEVNAAFFVEEGYPGRDIPRFAEEHGSDLIVLPTHGLSGLEAFTMGSVAERVVRRARVPVLVVKAFQKSILEGGHPGTPGDRSG